MSIFLLSLFPISLVALALSSLLWLAFGLLRLTRKRTIPWLLPAATIVIAVATVATYIYPTRPFILRGRQVRSLANMQLLRGLLEDYFEANGQYPQELLPVLQGRTDSEIRDGWGFEFHYESKGNAYILVGLGSDMAQDGTDYWQLRNAGRPTQRVAGKWKSDQVASDIGWHREAGK